MWYPIQSESVPKLCLQPSGVIGSRYQRLDEAKDILSTFLGLVLDLIFNFKLFRKIPQCNPESPISFKA